MRVVIQKVKKASVVVQGNLISSIGKGLMLLVGISTTDTEDDVKKLSDKIVKLRIFEDMSQATDTATEWEGRPWSKSLMDLNDHKVLSVSQFTLYGTISKGTKPDFHRAAKGETALVLYRRFLENLQSQLGENRVFDGKFGAMMDVEIVNDGPVTIIWDTRDGRM